MFDRLIIASAKRAAVEVAATAPSIYSASANGKGVAAATFIRITRAGVRSKGCLTGDVPAALGDQTYLIL